MFSLSSKDPAIQDDLKNWPFHVKDNGAGVPVIELDFSGKKQELKPQEVSAAVLAKLKEAAEQHCKKPVTHAVITVPGTWVYVRNWIAQHTSMIRNVLQQNKQEKLQV